MQLLIRNLKVVVQGKKILHGVDLVVNLGEIHAIMGPNGSGKSTMAYALAGHPDYRVAVDSVVELNGQNLWDLSPDQRSQAGLFLAFQYPVEVPGVKVQNFLRQAYQARFANRSKRQFSTVLAFREYLTQLANDFQVPTSLLSRGLNEGFSGGEKKRLEILQMALLEPEFAILDETDSGLDIDAIKIVAVGVKRVVEKYQTGVIIITHYQRILKYLRPNFVHLLVNGKITRSAGPELAVELEKKGYRIGQQ